MRYNPAREQTREDSGVTVSSFMSAQRQQFDAERIDLFKLYKHCSQHVSTVIGVVMSSRTRGGDRRHPYKRGSFRPIWAFDEWKRGYEHST